MNTTGVRRGRLALTGIFSTFWDRGAALSAKTVSSREFNQDVSGAKRAAADGPVFITDRGRPAHVLLSIDAYHRLIGGRATIGELLAAPGAEDIDFDPPRATGLFRPADPP